MIEVNMSDEAVLVELGSRIARVRLNKNITQKTLAQESGVSLPTIQRLEQGESTNLTNLIRVLRTLGLLENINTLVPKPPVSPMMQIKTKGHVRSRASGTRVEDNNSPWSWSE